MAKSHINASMFPAATRYYTQYEGKRCALPLLADTYGLYYNKTLFKKAGITQPAEDDQRAHRRREEADAAEQGRLVQGRRPRPDIGFYENVPERWVAAFGGKWTDAKGNVDPREAARLGEVAQVAEEPHRLVRVQEPREVPGGARRRVLLVDAFEIGKLAMVIDGEWRVAFIQNEHPELNYGTAPLPVDDAHPELYGSGYINGTIIGIPKNGGTRRPGVGSRQVPDDEHARARGAVERAPQRAVDVGLDALEGADVPDAHFAPFLKIFANPKSGTSPITASGQSYINLVQQFVIKWQAGKVKDLAGGPA